MEKMQIISQALVNIKPNAQWALRGDTYADLEWLDKNISKPTEDEINVAIANIPNVEAQQKQTQEAAKASALAKLAALGLTQDEIKALIG